MQLLHLFADPRAESVAVFAFGLGCLALKRWRTAITAVVLASAWLWLCATPAFALAMQAQLASRYPVQPVTALPQADAIVGVGGDLLPSGLAGWNAEVQPEHSTTLGFVLALYRAHKAPLVALTSSNATPTATAALVRQGVPARSIAAYPVSADTHDDAMLVAQALHAWNARRILLVTSGMHMARTAAVFEKQGFEVIAAPTLPTPPQAGHGAEWRPRRSAIHLSERALHEYFGLVYYRMRGWASW